MESLWQDLRYSARILIKKPLFTAVAVFALALGIGSSSAIFSVVNALLLQPLAYANPDRLVSVWETYAKESWGQKVPASPANFLDWRDDNRVFDQIAAFRSRNLNVTDRAQSERLQGTVTSASFFTVLGVRPLLGRTFVPEEEQPGKNQVVVVSEGLWQRRFGSDPALIGQTLTIDGERFTVIGIMPASFRFPERTELWLPPRDRVPEHKAGATEVTQMRDTRYLQVIARVKPGLTLAEAKADLDLVAGRLVRQYPDTNGEWGITIVPLHKQLVGDIQPTLLVLAGAVACVLLIACANVANLQMAQATVREKEMAIRLALGASRGRIIRQLLSESLLLSILGAALGLLLAYWGLKGLVAVSPAELPRSQEIALDGWVLAFTLVVSLLTGVVFGLAPALQTAKVNLNETLKDGGRGSTGGPKRNRLRSLLVASEVALALVLLIGAGLFVSSLVRLQQVEAGFDPSQALTMQVSPTGPRYREEQSQQRFFKQALERIAALPGVKAAGAIDSLPLSGTGARVSLLLEGRPVDPSQTPMVGGHVVSPDYFRAMGISLLKGRKFAERDDKASLKVALVSRALAERFWPNTDPVGRRIRIEAGDPWMTIVGVVGNVRHQGLNSEPELALYVPYLQSDWQPSTIVVRTETDPRALAGAIRTEVQAVDREQPVMDIKTLEQHLANSTAAARLNTLLVGGFAGAALLLAIIGIYGVMAYSVNQRTHEFGVRLSLGARPRDIFKLVMQEGIVLALAGITVGLAVAFVAAQFLASLLFGISAADAPTFAVVALLLVAVVMVASFVPARRATRVDPMVALRCE